MTTAEAPTAPQDPTTPPEGDDRVEADEDDEDSRTALQHFGAFAREFFFIVVGAVVVATLLRMFVGQMFLIPSASMESTLMIGDRVVAQKITDPQRGDVVVFSDPGGWLRNARTTKRGPGGQALQFIGVLPDLTKGDLVKRIIGMPGDKVVCCDSSGRITVNGQPLDETSYLFHDPSGLQVKPSEVRFQVVVPVGRLFVMGDNRIESADSRCHLSDSWQGGRKGAAAFVPVKGVVGPVFAVVAPFNHMSRLRVPATFAAVPNATQPAPAEAVISPAGVVC